MVKLEQTFPGHWVWRAVAFVVVFAALQLSWQAAHGTAVERTVVQTWTVGCATALVNLLTPAVHATAVKATVHAAGGSLNVINGCDGVDVAFLLVAAFLVAPLAWRSRLSGLACGLPFVFALNQGRILALFYAFRANNGSFDVLHGTVAPVAVIILVCGFFYGWLQAARRVPLAHAGHAELQ